MPQLTPSPFRSDQPFALRPRWIFPVDRPPIEGRIVTIAGGRIIAVGENVSGRPVHDLGDVALVPGLSIAYASWNSVCSSSRWASRELILQFGFSGWWRGGGSRGP